MKISINWISDFVDLPTGLSDKDLAERITLSVCEVEGVERIGTILEEVVIAEIISVVPHPDAEKLKLATVNTGGNEVTVVCGAENCRTGIKVPYAAIGVTLPTGVTLQKKRIRGIESCGMLCAEDELGLSDKHEGLMEIDGDIQTGSTLSQALGDAAASDLLLDIDNKSLTHRPDCWGHYGLAREFAAVFYKPFRDRFNKSWADSIKKKIGVSEPPVTIHVDRNSANQGFVGLSVDGVRIGISPDWMQRRLIAAGMRPVNTIVDISNYVMLEMGIPNHIFDRNAISGGKIIVRRAGRDMNFTTLDGQVRALKASDTMVCDTRHELAIAGIMGGMESSISDETTQIMIEAANWTDVEIRRTGTRLGLRTDASIRYEKSLDSQQLEKSILRIYELILQFNPDARASGGIQTDNMPEPLDLAIKICLPGISELLGISIDKETLHDILERLDFKVSDIPGSSTEFMIHVPSWRSTKDIECEVDIAEEIGRIIGYEKIIPVSPGHDIRPLQLSPGKKLFRKIQDFMVLRGHALEIMTYPLIGPSLLHKASWPIMNENLCLANALNPEQDRMRPSLIPSLLQAAADNRKRYDTFRLFECGRAYINPEHKNCFPDLHQVGIVFQAENKTPVIELIDTVEELLKYLDLPGNVIQGDPQKPHKLIPEAWAGSHPHEFLDVLIKGESRGVLLSVHPQITETFKIKGRTSLAVLDFTDSMDQSIISKTTFKSLDRFPGAVFDVTVVMQKNAYISNAVDAVNNLRIKEIRSVRILDIFNLEEKSKAVTLRIEMRDADKTLDTGFLQNTERKIIEWLDEEGFPLRV